MENKPKRPATLSKEDVKRIKKNQERLKESMLKNMKAFSDFINKDANKKVA